VVDLCKIKAINIRNLLTVVLVSLFTLVALIAGHFERTNEAPPTFIADNITTQQAFDLIQKNQSNPNFVILDVRTPEEFAETRVSDAINIDFNSQTFRDEINNLDKSKIYLVYCRTGARSAQALNLMTELGFSEVHNMLGGITQWIVEERPIVK
jgi:rhodanese-related sulfurtransferase